MRCNKCWCPAELGHNTGCPEISENPQSQIDFDRGYAAGFNPCGDPLSPSQIARLPNKSYALGYRAGLAHIDRLADDAAQSRCFG